VAGGIVGLGLPKGARGGTRQENPSAAEAQWVGRAEWGENAPARPGATVLKPRTLLAGCWWGKRAAVGCGGAAWAVIRSRPA
jgi:hypothetical protein